MVIKNDNMKQKSSFWEIMFYLSLAIFMIWVILKSIGVIKTPFWLEYGIPATTLATVFLSFYKRIIDNIAKLAVTVATLAVKFDHLEKKVDHIDNDLEIVRIDVATLKSDMSSVKNDMRSLKKK